MTGQIVLYYLGTEVDRLNVRFRSMKGMMAVINEFFKWRGVDKADPQYKLDMEYFGTIKTKGPDATSPIN